MSLSLYIHMPWCVKKCPYCDFNSHALKGEIDEQSYIKALIDDLDSHQLPTDSRFLSIFIGGGTPSLFSAQAYQRLFKHLQQNYSLHSDIEITLEANPGTIDFEKFQSYCDVGINRLSIGVQSFNDKHLQKLGRIHNSDHAKRAIDIAQQAGFKNFNLDLMHGLPNQTDLEAAQDLKTALSFKPPHLSWYQLTIEPNTVFYKQHPTLPNEQQLEAIENIGQHCLSDYQHYEISAFCLPEHQCQHNLNYWRFGDYLGIGAGAHSKLTQNSDTLEVSRFEKKRMPKE